MVNIIKNEKMIIHSIKWRDLLGIINKHLFVVFFFILSLVTLSMYSFTKLGSIFKYDKILLKYITSDNLAAFSNILLILSIAYSLISLLCYIYHAQINKFLYKSSVSCLKIKFNSHNFPKWFIVYILLAILFYYNCIISGYFYLDDFNILELIIRIPFSKYIFMTTNDHTLPLYFIESALMYNIFGTTALGYNLFILIILILIPISTFFLFRELDISYLSTITILALFIAFPIWKDFFFFYITSIYLQVVLFYSVAMWAFIHWYKNKKFVYLCISLLSVTFAVFIDITGLWVICAILIFSLLIYYLNHGDLNIYHFLRSNSAFLIGLAVVILIISVYNYYVFMILYKDAFLTTPLSTNIINIILNYIYFFGSIPLTLFIPVDYLKYFSYNITSLLKIILFALFAFHLIFMIYVLPGINKNYRALIGYFVLILSGVILTIVVKRPPLEHHAVSLEVRYMPAPLYLYCTILSLSVAGCIDKIKFSEKHIFNFKLLCIGLVLVFNVNLFNYLVFKLHTKILPDRIEASKKRKNSVEGFNANLIIPLASSIKNNEVIRIPNLDPLYVHMVNSYFYYYLDLSYFIQVFNLDRDKKIKLIRNRVMEQSPEVEIVRSLRKCTDPVFIKLLKESDPVRNYYLSANVMRVTDSDVNIDEGENRNIEEGVNKCVQVDSEGGCSEIIMRGKINPETRHLLQFQLETELKEADIQIKFKNDFNVSHSLGIIKLTGLNDNEYTVKPNLSGKYYVKIDLLQIYGYALSDMVEDLELIFLTRGKYNLSGIRLD